MHRRRMVVLYRENCGGTLRHLAVGLRRSVNTRADLDLYDDLRERIFREDTPGVAEQKEKSAA